MMDHKALNHLKSHGWHYLGCYPENDPDGVGSWIIEHNGRSALLEIPSQVTACRVTKHLRTTRTELSYITCSHDHDDHLDMMTWEMLKRLFPVAQFIYPFDVDGYRLLNLGGEPLWLLGFPKHSESDVVTVFRGVAMTGDIEIGTLDSVNDEVSESVKRESMDALRDFPSLASYHIHTVFSAHMNDYKTNVNWPSLFKY